MYILLLYLLKRDANFFINIFLYIYIRWRLLERKYKYKYETMWKYKQMNRLGSARAWSRRASSFGRLLVVFAAFRTAATVWARAWPWRFLLGVGGGRCCRFVAVLAARTCRHVEFFVVFASSSIAVVVILVVVADSWRTRAPAWRARFRLNLTLLLLLILYLLSSRNRNSRSVYIYLIQVILSNLKFKLPKYLHKYLIVLSIT